MSRRVTLSEKLAPNETPVLRKGRPEIVVPAPDGEYILMSVDEAQEVKKWLVDVCGAWASYDGFPWIMALLSGETHRFWECPTCGMTNYTSDVCTGCLTRRGEPG